MIGAALLRPALDALAPEDKAAAGRRVRNGALAMAIAAWLLPEHPSLGTDTTLHRALISAAFAAVAVAAQFRTRWKWARVALPVACLAAAGLVAWFGHGALWGFGFLVFAVIVTQATELRRKYVRMPAEELELDPLPPQPGGWPRTLNWLAWTVISVFFVTEWAGRAMVVPTKSMQPTIMGGEERIPTWKNLWSPGDHLIADQFSYDFREPRRWEIVVFHFPLLWDRLFVKRLIGLPGEHVEIRDGDIWVDGKIARKPPLVQATLWYELFPRAGGTFLKSLPDGFDARDGWKSESPRQMLATPGPKAPIFARFKATVLDARVAFTAVPRSAGAAAIARITCRGTPVTLTVPASGAGTLDVGKSGTSFDGSLGASARIELCVADGEAWALVNGSEVARASVPTGGRGENRVEIGASGGPVSFTEHFVARDIQYVSQGTAGAWDVPADGYFFVGDNQGTVNGAPASLDSRLWRVEVFHAPSGQILRAATSIVSESGRGADANIKVDGAVYRFKDVDGVTREVPREGTTIDKSVPWPFAQRRHLVGRAILVFWPWNVDVAGFRPRLLP